MENNKIWASAVLMFGGLAMVVLGGCFLIGVMLVVTNQLCFSSLPTGSEFRPIELSLSQQTFVKVLYTLSLASFGAATMLVVTAAKRLMRIS